jgi:Winged helix DNA-binding domain
MSFSFSQDITIISLVLAAVALIVTVVLGTVLVKRIGKMSAGNVAVDVSAVVQEFSERQKQLEQRIIDQKVNLEILELRLSKEDASSRELHSIRGIKSRPVVAEQFSVGQAVQKEELEPSAKNMAANKGRSGPIPALSESTVRMDATTMQILRAVTDGNGNSTARQIQERIGRSREHTARMMNLLYREGLVSRDVNARPFRYSVTEAGRNLLNE